MRRSSESPAASLNTDHINLEASGLGEKRELLLFLNFISIRTLTTGVKRFLGLDHDRDCRGGQLPQ